METCLFRPPLPFAIPLQGQARGRPPRGRGGDQPGRAPAGQHPRLPHRHRLQRDQAQKHPEAHHAGLLRVPAAGRGQGRHAGLDQGHQGEQQDRQRGENRSSSSYTAYSNSHTHILKSFYCVLFIPGDRFLKTSSHQQEAE